MFDGRLEVEQCQVRLGVAERFADGLDRKVEVARRVLLVPGVGPHRPDELAHGHVASLEVELPAPRVPADDEVLPLRDWSFPRLIGSGCARVWPWKRPGARKTAEIAFEVLKASAQLVHLGSEFALLQVGSHCAATIIEENNTQ